MANMYATDNLFFNVNVKKARWLLRAFALCLAAMAIGLFISRSGEAFLPLLWPIWFGLSSVASLSFSFMLDNRRLMMISGFLVPMGFFVRVAGIILNALEGNYLLASRSVSGVALYVIAGLSLAAFWNWVFAPLQGVLQARREAKSGKNKGYQFRRWFKSTNISQ